MPEFSDISHVPLDMFQMIKNQSAGESQSCQVCPVFLYFQFPPKGIPAQFSQMTFDKTNTNAYNVLNYQYKDDANPIIYISTLGNFTTPNLQKFSPLGFQITQKIHTTYAMSTSTNDDLQMIIECKSASGSSTKLFLHIMLTKDLSTTGNSGGDFNTLFNVLKTGNLVSNTPQFQTDNVKELPTNLNFFMGINNILLNDKINSDQPYLFCFYYTDDNNNIHILLQNPIPISDPNFVVVQDYFKKYGLAQNPFTIYMNSTLAPSKSGSVIKDALLFAYPTLAIAQNKKPLTADAYTKKQASGKRDENVKDKSKDLPESFVGGKITEGLKTMNCKVANSSSNLIATLVSDNTEGTEANSKLAGYQLFLSLGVFFLVIFGCFLLNRQYMLLLPPLSLIFSESDKTETKKNGLTLEYIIKKFESINLWRNICTIILLFIAIGFIIPVTVPKVPASTAFPLLICGFVFLIFALINYYGVSIFNESVSDNRYSYTYRLIEKFMPDFKGKLLDKKFDTDDNTYLINNNEYYKYDGSTGTPVKDPEQIIYIFIHMCMSYYLGDRKWFKMNENPKKNILINKIEFDKEKHTIKVLYDNDKELANFIKTKDIIIKIP